MIFKDGGNSYELQPSGIFDINDSFFANLGIIDPLSCIFPGEGAPFSKLTLEQTNQSITESLSGGEDGVLQRKSKAIYTRM